jgi:hypothetical protein
MPQEILRAIESQGLDLDVSKPIMDEVAEILVDKFGWTRAEVDYALPPLWARCTGSWIARFMPRPA